MKIRAKENFEKFLEVFIREVSFFTGRGAPENRGIRHFFLDQKGIKRFFEIRKGDHLYFLKK